MRQSILGCKHHFRSKILLFSLAAVVLSAFMHDHGFGRDYEHYPYHHGQIKHGGHTHAEPSPADQHQDIFDLNHAEPACCIHHEHPGKDHSHDLVTTHQRVRIRSGSLEGSWWLSALSDVSIVSLRNAPCKILNHFRKILPSPNPYLILTSTDLPPPIL